MRLFGGMGVPEGCFRYFHHISSWLLMIWIAAYRSPLPSDSLSIYLYFLSSFLFPVLVLLFHFLYICTQRGSHNSSRVWLDQTIRKRAIRAWQLWGSIIVLGFFTSSSFFKCYAAASPFPSSIKTLPLHGFKCLSIIRHFHWLSNIHGTYVAWHLYQLFML